MDPNRLGYFADDVRIHVLIVTFPTDMKSHTTHVGQPFVPELRIPSKGTSNTSHLLSPWPLAAACSLFQDIQWWIPITFLTHFAIQSGPTRKITQNGAPTWTKYVYYYIYMNTSIQDWVSFVHLLLAPIPIYIYLNCPVLCLCARAGVWHSTYPYPRYVVMCSSSCCTTHQSLRLPSSFTPVRQRA